MRLLLLGAALVGLTLAGLALHEPGAIILPSLLHAQILVGLMALAGAAYLLAVRQVLATPLPRGALSLVLTVALAARLPLLLEAPFLSSDVFRYVWDGMVQAGGINPYRYVPADPALAAFRDAAIYPHIGRADYAPTIYPPVAELVFRLVGRIAPTVTAMKATMVLFEAAGIVAMLRLLDLAALPRARVLIYAWNPLPIWAFAGNGHVDALAVGFIGWALLAAAGRRATAAGALLGCAVLVKFLPAAIAPALWRRFDWRLPLAAIVVIGGAYLVYLGAGWKVLGFLPGYALEEGIDRGAAFWLLAGIAHIAPGASLVHVYEAAGVAVLLGLAAWVALFSRPAMHPPAEHVRMCRGAAMLAGATMVVLSPHYPWYFAWLALPCCVAPLRSVIWLGVAALLLYVNPWDERFVWPSLLFVPAFALACLDVRRPLAARRI